MISDLKPAAGDEEEEEEQNIDDADDVVIYDRSPTSGIIDTAIDPSVIVRADAFVLKQQSHPLQLAPFILAIEPDQSVLLEPCRLRYSDWDPEHARVCGAFGTCPWSDENGNVQTHTTIGLFAAHPSVSADDDGDLIVYIIDGKDHDFVDNEDYLECRNAAVDAFKTKVLHLPCSTPHSTHVIGFSRLPANDWTHSSLHVRQCFRELAATMVGTGASFGSNSSRISTFSSLAVHVGNCFFSHRDGNSFPSDTLFDGVRIQIARRCWTKDLENLTTCLINRDNEPTLCANTYCDKHVSRARYCSSSCFTRGWKDHNRLHRRQAKTAALDQQQQQEEEEKEEDEGQAQESPPPPPPPPSRQQQQQQEQEQQLKPQEHVPLKSEKGGGDDVEEEEAQTAGVGIASPTASGAVRIDGAIGTSTYLIDGVYEATTEMSGGMPVYVKVGRCDLWLEYCADSKQWQLKPTAGKGKDGGFACCAVPAKCLPDKCPPGQWWVVDGGKAVQQSAVTISVVTQGEVAAYLTEVAREATRVVECSYNVRIAGVTGPKAVIINGIYKPTKEKHDNATLYVKVDDVDTCLEYRAGSRQWQVKAATAMGTSVCSAYTGVLTKCLPQDCPPGQWQVAAGTKFDPQPTITISEITQGEVDAYLAEVEREAARVVDGSQHVRITGVTGSNTGIINGIYKPTEEKCDNATVYVKVDDSDMCLTYRARVKQWEVKLTVGKGTSSGLAFCGVPVKCLPEKCPAGQWEVADCRKLVSQPAVTISEVTQEEVGAYLAEVQREAARMVRGSQHVRITGSTAGIINGVYKPTEELCNNATVFVKLEDDDMWLEYNAAMKQWQVKRTSQKGTVNCLAFCVVPAKCLPEGCPRDKWLVENGTKWEPQPAFSISVQHDNNDAASADDVDDDEAKPKATAMKIAAGLDDAPTAGVGLVSPVASGGVRIVGAMGPNAGRINGIYEVTTEMSGDMPVYVKVGNGDMWLEYHAPTSEWQMKTTASKGKDVGLANCVVPSKCFLEECPAGQWKICVNGTFVPLPAIVISLVAQEEVEAYRAQVEEEAARVVKGNHDVTITGATGTFAGDINGVYKPTEELCDNATVYVKVGERSRWLEYNAAMKQWQVKPTGDKGTRSCWAYCAVPVKCLPEDCPRGKWLAANGAKWGPQQTVTLSVQRDNSDAASTGDVDDDEAKPKAAAMKVESGSVVAPTAGVGGGLATSAKSGGVRIVGATGIHAGAVNGMYEAMIDLSGGMPVYVKVGSRDMRLEYYAPTNRWQAIGAANKNTSIASAFCNVPAECLPQKCPAGRWVVVEGEKWVPQPAVSISVVTQRHVDAYLAEVQREAARMVRGNQHVLIKGATGPNAGHINGMYKPTAELSSNVTVYVKVDDGDICLEYRPNLLQWQVKNTFAKGKDGGLAYCAVPAKCLPEKCPVGRWKVVESGKFLSQPAITIKQKKR